MAESKASRQIKEGEVVGAPLVQSTTDATPSPADETSMPNHLNTETEQPPVRTGRPDTPIAQTMAAGAGAHTPPDPDVFGPDGRPRNADDVGATDENENARPVRGGQGGSK
jgi:hypothetical protein